MMKTYLGYINDDKLRWAATSGGIGTAIIKYLFETKQIETALTFEFNARELKYFPKLIYSFDEYEPVGSIYNEVDLVAFIREKVFEIRGGFACFCLPCQCKAVRHILANNKHESFIIGLTCSSQQSVEATEYLLKRMNLNRSDVQGLRYRGNGWPSGIQITMKDGIMKQIPNNNSLWTEIFHSRLFVMPRCLRCNETIAVNADITLADPWSLPIAKTDKVGHTLCFVMTKEGENIFDNMEKQELITSVPMNEVESLMTQITTILRKRLYKRGGRKLNLFLRLLKSEVYRRLVLSNSMLFKLHCRLLKPFFER